jgi:hypothetical protein
MNMMMIVMMMDDAAHAVLLPVRSDALCIHLVAKLTGILHSSLRSDRRVDY